MNLKEIRAEISQIDEEILNLLGRRFKLIPNIIEEKKKFGLAVFQPEREKQMHQKYWKMALNENINPELVRKIFDLIITEMREIQEESLDE